MADPDQLSDDPPGGSRPRRQFRSVSDLRHEVTRLYWAVDAGQLASAEASRRVQVLHLVAKLMTENEPEVELRGIREENARLRRDLGELRSLLQSLKGEAEPWSGPRQSPASRPS